jgi:hypothetical protein
MWHVMACCLGLKEDLRCLDHLHGQDLKVQSKVCTKVCLCVEIMSYGAQLCTYDTTSTWSTREVLGLIGLYCKMYEYNQSMECFYMWQY